jgi:hypothetical protein
MSWQRSYGDDGIAENPDTDKKETSPGRGAGLEARFHRRIGHVFILRHKDDRGKA